MVYSQDEKDTLAQSASSDDPNSPAASVKKLADASVQEKVEEDNTPQYDFSSPEFANIPDLVRTVVGFEDDPALLVITFRSVLLSIFFCVLGSVISQISYFRTTYAPFPIFFVILASAPLGRLLARVLPAFQVPLGMCSSTSN